MANNANTLGRLNEILFAELERLNALDATDKDALEAAITYARITKRRNDLARERRALEGHPWAQDVKGDSRPATARND